MKRAPGRPRRRWEDNMNGFWGNRVGCDELDSSGSG
jgi:hypothetical protein